MEVIMPEGKQQVKEIEVISRKIQSGMEVFEQRKQSLIEKADGYKSLEIKDHTDKAGYNVVETARKSLKAERVQIAKEGKLMRDPLNDINRMISAKEKELIAITEPIELALSSKSEFYEKENIRIEEEKKAKEAARIQGMFDQLTAYNFPVNIENLKIATEEEFAETLAYAKQAFETAEAERIALENAEIARKQAEADQLRKDQEELAELRKQQAETARLQADAQSKIDAENKRIEEEKKAIEAAKQKVIDDANRAAELESAKKQAAEDARIKALQFAKEQEEKRIEAEKKEAALAEKKARLAPDKDKLILFANQLGTVINFQVTSPEAQAIVNDTINLLAKVQKMIIDRSANL